MARNPLLIAAAASLIIYVSGTVLCQQPPPPPPAAIGGLSTGVSASLRLSNLTPEAQRRQDAFEKAWNVIDKNYYDPTFNGVNWVKVREEFQPRVTAAKTDREFHLLLQEMISRLGKSHLSIVPPDYFKTVGAAKREARKNEALSAGKPLEDRLANGDADDDEDFTVPGTKYGIGVDLRLLNDRVVITHIAPQSGAVVAGLKTGYIIEKINGVSMPDFVRRVRSNLTYGRGEYRLLPDEIVYWFLNGDPKTSVHLTVLDENDAVREITVPRLALDGRAIDLGPNYPTQYLDFEARSLDNDTGYIRFNMFALPVIDKLCDALTQFKDKSSIIVDLRGNHGGLIASLIGLSGMLTDTEMPIGISTYRASKEQLNSQSKAKNYKGKLVIIIDGQSMSASEFFAAAFRESGRAVLVGEHTAGAALPALSVKLQTGAVLEYPIANFMTPGGKYIEGVGITPDFEVPLDRKALLEGHDAPLEKAISIAKEKTIVDNSQHSTAAARPMWGDPIPPPPPPAPRPTPTAKGKSGGRKEIKVERIVKIPPPRAMPAPKPNDPKAVAVIEAFRKAVDATGRLGALQTYAVLGNVNVGYRGSEANVKLESYRQMPDKFSMTINNPGSISQHTFYNGKIEHMQTNYGVEREKPFTSDLNRSDLFAPLLLPLDGKFLHSLKYEGRFIDGGGQREVLSAMSADGYAVGLSFDPTTHLLATFSQPGLVYTLEDYRAVDGIMFPFHLKAENVIDIHITSLKVNEAVDPSNFERRDYCFDKAN